MNAYVPIIAMVVLATVFVAVAIALSVVVGPRRYNRTKYDSFECGLEPTPQPDGGGRFSVKYYITAMLFIVFDIEIVFLYPWAVGFNRMATFGILAMLLLVAVLFVAYLYVLRRGGLEWE